MQSRYYNPEAGRFLNADIYASTGQGFLGNNMFAYCLNNPVNQIDPTGAASLWYYLIIDHDMGFIHRAVQAHILAKYKNIKTELVLSTGRADIIRGNCVWEIKHEGYSKVARTIEAQAQAKKYTGKKTGMKLGAAGAFKGSFYVQCLDSSYIVRYNTPAKGAILYSVKEVKNYKGSYFLAYVPASERKNVLHSIPSVGTIGVAGVYATTIAAVGTAFMCAAVFPLGKGSGQFMERQ